MIGQNHSTGFKKRKTIVPLKLNDCIVDFHCSGVKISLTKLEAKAFVKICKDCSWETFEEFKESLKFIWCTIVDKDDWKKKSSCTCPYFMKNYLCKHIIGIANRRKLPGATIPEQAKNIPLGQKRKRGRQAAITRALLL